MDGRPTMKDQLYLDKLEKICEAGDLIAHRLKEINGTLGRIEFAMAQFDYNYTSKDCNSPSPLEVVDDPYSYTNYNET